MAEQEYTTINVKVKREDANSFVDKCRRSYCKKGTDMLRELIEAFNEGRITIEPSEAQKALNQEIYGGKS